MGAGTAQRGACLLISGKVRKIWNLLYLRAYCFCFYIYDSAGADTDEKSGKTFQEVSS